jgi:hypothetical protein
MRKAAAIATAVVSLALVAPASAAPNGDHASCEAILTSPDAHVQIRDDVAREFAAEVPPGDIYSAAARATGTTSSLIAPTSRRARVDGADGTAPTPCAGSLMPGRR